jgi:polyvinyl alcohol dehydrogenase (cytochrome)
MHDRILANAASLIVALSPLAAGAESRDTTPTGEAVFRRVCAACHVGVAQTAGVTTAGTLGAHAVPREYMRMYPPEAVLNALTNGKMQAQGSTLSESERRAVAEFATGRRLDASKPLDPAAENGKPCTTAAPAMDPARGPSWNGWGNGITNTRFQPQAAAGLTASDLPRLRLKWAFGYANVSSARTQPALVGGRLFVASENGQVHSLDAKTGCTHWSFKAQAGVVTALTVGSYRTVSGKTGHAVYFGDRKANAYGVDADSGLQIWVRKVDEHPSAAITGAPAYFSGRVYVPVQGIGEEGRAGRDNYSCCTFRGSVSALDAGTGALLWKTYTVAESRPRAKNKDGIQMYGPAGGGIWSAPTIDSKRKLLYVATGNGYSEPAQPTTDAVLALDLETGALRWSRQVLPNDIWAMGCDEHNQGNPACPATLGGDFDFSASPALASVDGHELLVLPQKSGLAFALDPAQQGSIVWQYRIGQGSGLGGQWGGAVEGDRVYFGVADFLTPKPGGMHAVRLLDGQAVWHEPPPTPLCDGHLGCSAAQGAAITAIAGAVLSGSLDGGLRAYSTQDGSILWTYDTTRDFETVNGVAAHGGGIDGPGPIVAGGMLYVTSGCGGLLGRPGNVLLAFSLD